VQSQIERDSRPSGGGDDTEVTVLLFTPAYPPDTGGAATFYTTLVSDLPAAYDVIVLTGYRADESVRSVDGGTTVLRVFPNVYALPDPVRVLLETVVLFAATLWLAGRGLVDVVHAHGSALSVVGIGLASTLTSTPVVYDCKDMGVRPWLVRLGPVATWLSCSSGLDEKLVDGGVPRDRIERVPVVNPDYVSTYADSGTGRQDTFEAIYVGAVRGAKGVPALIRGFAAVDRDAHPMQLTVVGDGPARERCERLADELGVEDAVTFTGRVLHERALEHIAEADVLVHPSESETGPRSVTEAFELGTPVVATPVGRVPEVLTHEVTGLLIDQRAVDIADALERLHADEQLRASIAAAAKEESERWSWDAVTERVRRVYADSVA